MESRYASFRSAAVIFYLLLATFATLETAQAQVNCYSQRLCNGTATVVGTIRECCLTSDGVTLAGGMSFEEGGEACQACVVFGWTAGYSFVASEQGEAYSLDVGYLKGADRAPGTGRLLFDVINTPGTAIEGASNDYRVSNTQNLDVRPTRDAQVQVTFRVDNVALEPDETLALTLDPQNTLARAPASNVFLLNTIQLTIQDSDVVSFQFTESDYRTREEARFVPVIVERNLRIATDVTLRITPVNFTVVNSTDFSFPADFPEVPQFDPIRPIIAKSLPDNERDFSISPIEVTFPRDEDNDSEDRPASIVVFDDTVNEADEVFVVLLEVVSDVPLAQVNLVPRNVSLCRIVDNDPIRLGFEFPRYNFTEQFRSFGATNSPVFLIKESDVISEQTFEVVVTAGPAQDVEDATPVESSSPDNPPDYRVTSPQTFIFEPVEDRIPVPFVLFEDINPELLEGFLLGSSPSELSPPFQSGTNPSTTIAIIDNDPLVIGFTETFTSVSEGVGQFQLCLSVTVPEPQVELPANLFIFIELQTEDGTAVEIEDYVRIDFDNNPLDDFTDDLRLQCFNVTIQDDSRLELTEQFSVTAFIESPTSLVVVDPSVSVVEIVNDDEVVIEFDPDTYTVNEGGQVEVCIVARSNFTVPLCVTFSTCDGTATAVSGESATGESASGSASGFGEDVHQAVAGEDYTPVTQKVTFQPGETKKIVTVQTLTDTVVEGTETFGIKLSNPSEGVQLGQDNGTVSINDTSEVVIEFDPNTYTVNEGGQAEVCIRARGNFTVPLCVTFSTCDGTATAGEDYTPVTQKVTFQPGETKKIVTVQTLTDTVVEGTETFGIKLSNPSEGVQLGQDNGTVSINDTNVVFFTFRRPMQILLENVGMGEVCVDKMGQTTETIRVMVTGNLQPGVGVLTQELTFGPDDVEMCVAFDVEDDNIALEEPENLPFTLTIIDSQRGVELGRFNRTVVVIIDDDDLFLTLVKPSTLPESVGSVEACIVFSNPFARPFDIAALSNSNVTNQSSAAAGADYSVVNMTITTTLADSAAGRVCFPIDITNDNLVEDDEECFAVEISIPEDEPTIFIAVGSATCCIVDDDDVMVGFGSPSVTVSESDGQFMMCVVKNASTIFPIVVTLVNSPISATPGDDYLPATIPQQVTIQPTEDRTCFTGDIVDDSIALEGTESFQIQITTATPAGVIIGLDTTTVFIVDDDVVMVRFEQPTYTATELAVEVCIVKDLETAVTRDVTLTTRDGTASSPADYIGGTFPVTLPTAPNARTCQTIVIVEDTGQEEDECFFVDLPILSNGIQTGNPGSAKVFIIRDVGELVNDTVVGDPLYTVPIFVPDIENSGLNSSRVSLCYEVHGQANDYFNLVTDECASVNARYHEVADFLNVIDQIGIRAVDNSTTRCRNIAVSLPNCSIEIDGREFTGNRYRQGGIYIRRYPGRVRVSVPNCQDLTLVMWVFCRTRSLENPFTGDTITTDTIKYEVMRGLNFGHRNAHGLIGQFWNVPVQVTMFTGQLRNGTQAPPGRFVINVTRPNSEPRVFTGCLYDLTWEFQEGPCLYSGNRQAGPIYEVSDPNDGVVEGTYRDYEVPGAFDETDYEFGRFNEDLCTP